MLRHGGTGNTGENRKLKGETGKRDEGCLGKVEQVNEMKDAQAGETGNTKGENRQLKGENR